MGGSFTLSCMLWKSVKGDMRLLLDRNEEHLPGSGSLSLSLFGYLGFGQLLSASYLPHMCSFCVPRAQDTFLFNHVCVCGCVFGRESVTIWRKFWPLR